MLNLTRLYANIILLVIVVACNKYSNSEGSASIETTSKAAIAAAPSKNYELDEQNQLILSSIKDYRRWIWVSSPVTPNDLNPPKAPLPEFHNIYIHPSDYEYWAENGEFKEGAIFVTDLVSVATTQTTSGNGYFQGEFLGLVASIKDSEAFPDEPGNWAYFNFGLIMPLAAKAKALETSRCNSCHQANAASDFVFTQYYPVLREARIK